MKISEFASKFNMNASAVRYYVNNGLLIPDIKNGQYWFGKSCTEDMEKILKLKRFHFSIEDIQLYLFLEKTSRFKDDVIRNLIREILEKKKEELLSEREEIDKSLADITEEIESLPEVAIDDTTKSGIPFAFIPSLYCPHCQLPLNLENASMSAGYLTNGALHCSCGYSAQIKDGIIECEGSYDDTPLKSFKLIDSVLGIYEDFSPPYRALVEKAYFMMYNAILGQDKDSPQMIMSGPFQYNFLLYYIEKLGKENTYIIMDPSRNRLRKIRSYLDNTGLNIVYIAGMLDQIPVKDRTVDVYIDDYAYTNCIFSFNAFDFDRIRRLLSHRGLVTGIFGDYKRAPQGLANFRSIQPGFQPEKLSFSHLKYDLSQGGMEMDKTKSAGLTSKDGDNYAQDVPGEQVEVLFYTAEKK